ncbi:MAG: hypothetical protein HY926_11300, partial [Elusimicrobia bacterium]|nr:hypothetical protein [Elusimicrobiota bacterium]
PAGILKGGGAGVPTAINGTQNQITYWTDANTIGSTAAISVGLGGTGADLTAVPTNALIYKDAATTLGSAGVMPAGILKGGGAGVPTAINGTQNRIAYWTDANTIGSTAAISVGLGGTGANLVPVATGGLIYKSAATTLAGTGQLTGVLKGTGAGAPTTADQDDLGDGATYKQYNPAAVAITGGRIGTATGLRLDNRTWVQLQGLTPTAVGQMYFCTTCTPAKIAVSNGLAMGNFTDVIGGALP